MNPYTTRTQARLQPRDVASVLRSGTGSFLAGASLAKLERQREWQAEAELHWLLEQDGISPEPAASLLAMLRNAIGGALVRAGERLIGASGSGISPDTSPAAARIGTSD